MWSISQCHRAQPHSTHAVMAFSRVCALFFHLFHLFREVIYQTNRVLFCGRGECSKLTRAAWSKFNASVKFPQTKTMYCSYTVARTSWLFCEHCVGTE